MTHGLPQMLLAIATVVGPSTPGEESTAGNYACVSATGERIPIPGSKRTYTVEDGEKRVQVLEGMAYVPAGKFTMGEGVSEHTVFLDAYCIGKYEVTNAEWKSFVDATGHAPPRHWKNGKLPEGKKNHPLLWVSWNSAREYCEWVSKQTGWTVTLPTEAQWEKAARGGPKGYRFPWGDDRDTKNCNYNGYCASKVGLNIARNGEVPTWREFTKTEKYREITAAGGFTTPVGMFPSGKSAYGPHDMAGNAYEWCMDWYKEDYYKLDGADLNPPGPDEKLADEVNKAEERGKNKVIRGGSWYGHFSSCTTTSRREVRNPRMGYHSVGFRVVALLP